MSDEPTGDYVKTDMTAADLTRLHNTNLEVKLPPMVLQEPAIPHDPMSLLQIAISKGASIENLEKLMDLQERFEKNLARKAFFSALSQFQSEMPTIAKNGRVDYPGEGGRVKYNFATLNDISVAIKPLLSKYGFSYRFKESTVNPISVTCIVSHLDGHIETNTLCGPPDVSGKKPPLKASSSTLSHLRRYSLTGSFGITSADIDDDVVPPSDEKDSFYSDKDFNENFPKWKEKIKSGKSSEFILKLLAKNGVKLSIDQAGKIRDLDK